MIAALDDASVLHADDEVGRLDGRQAMRHDDGGAALASLKTPTRRTLSAKQFLVPSVLRHISKELLITIIIIFYFGISSTNKLL